MLVVQVRDNFVGRLRAQVDKTGRAKVLGVAEGFLRHAATSIRLAALLQREQRHALKIFATNPYGVHQVVVELFGKLLSDEHAAGDLDLPVPAPTLAHGVVGLIEAALYAAVVAGQRRDI